jgi:hypothetical protein
MDYEQKLATTPSGLVLYHPPGNKGVTPRRLGTEFLTEAIEAVLIVFLIAKARLASSEHGWPLRPSWVFLRRFLPMSLIGIGMVFRETTPLRTW